MNLLHLVDALILQSVLQSCHKIATLFLSHGCAWFLHLDPGAGVEFMCRTKGMRSWSDLEHLLAGPETGRSSVALVV